MTNRGIVALLKERELVTVLSGRPPKVKPGLPGLAEEVLRMCACAAPQISDPFSKDSTQAIAAFNRGALIQHRYGEQARARQLLAQGTATCARYCRASGHWGWKWNMIDSYHNAARLNAIEGDVQGAVESFRCLWLFYLGREALRTDEHYIEPDPTHRQAAHGLGDDLVKTAPYVYLQGVATTFMINRRYSDLLTFLAERERDRNASDLRGYVCCLYEWFARAYAAVGQIQCALDAIMSLEQNAAGRPLAALLRTDVLCQTGDHDRARSELRNAVQQMANARRQQFGCVYLGAVLACDLEEYATGEKCAEQALAIAGAAADQPNVLKAMAIQNELSLGRHDSEPVRARADAYIGAVSNCFYRFDRALGFHIIGSQMLRSEMREAAGLTSAECSRRALAAMKHTECAESPFLRRIAMSELESAPATGGAVDSDCSFRNQLCEDVYSALINRSAPSHREYRPMIGSSAVAAPEA